MRSVLKSSIRKLVTAQFTAPFLRCSLPFSHVNNLSTNQQVRSFARASKSKSTTSLTEALQREIAEEEADIEVDEVYKQLRDVVSKYFTIHDVEGSSKVTLSREMNGERIDVIFNILEGAEEEFTDNLDDISLDENEEPAIVVGLHCDVEVSRPDGSSLYFDGVAATDYSIKNVQYIPANPEEDTTVYYTGPSFSDLEPSVQKAFHNYLEERGVGNAMSCFVMNHARERFQAEDIKFYKNLLEFTKK